MSGVTVTAVLQDITKIESEAMIVGFFEDVRPLKGPAGQLDWLLCGALSRLVLDRKLQGSLGQVALLTSQGKVPVQKIFLIGLGPRAELSPAVLQSAARTAAGSVSGAGVKKAVLEWFPTAGLPEEQQMTALRSGLQEGASGRGLEMTLLAPDRGVFDRIIKYVPAAQS
jgi:hypothetical protein